VLSEVEHHLKLNLMHIQSIESVVDDFCDICLKLLTKHGNIVIKVMTGSVH